MIPRGQRSHPLPEARTRLRLALPGWVAILFLAISGCKPTPTSSSAPKGGSEVASNGKNAASEAPGTPALPDYLPAIHSRDGYVGSGPCRECHVDEHSSWHRSFHRTMTQLPVPGAIQANFNHVILTNDQTRFTLLHDDDRYGVRVESLAPRDPGQPPAEPTQIVLGLVTGSHHMQVFWLPNGMGNCQVGFPFTWLIPEQRWVPRDLTFLRPPDVRLRPEVWNALCIRCHATGMEPHFRPSQNQIATEVAELGISCEACHGPAGTHVEFARKHPRTGAAAAGSVTNWFIVQPAKLPAGRGSEVCAFCHSMKWLNPSEHWFDRGFSYRPGDALEASTPVIRQNPENAPAGLVEYLKSNPEVMGDFFWPDGMIRVSGREHNGLIESPCHRGGAFTCFSCHSLHQGEPDDQLAPNRRDDRACTQCHTQYADPVRRSGHTHHSTASSGSECYNCHLPHTTYGVLSAIRSHTVSSPRVSTELATGRPNACNLCHLDQTLGWTARWLETWYRQKAPELGPTESGVADGVRLALAGDAGQRVLLAWHFGWQPALAVSGTNWPAWVLGELLDDSYGAVRCVAERSLKTLRPAALEGYDFTLAPDSAAPASDRVWRTLTGSGSPATVAAPPDQSARTGIDLQDPAASRERLRRLRAGRNDRPVRLRE